MAFKRGKNWGVSVEPIYWFIFHSIFIPNWGMVGSLSVKSGFIIEFIFDNLPTLQIWGEKK
ncbi:MAG: hypothetical protein DRR16_03620 [Candidatus Parabeggiatoa sp. nov. 3]|nr:MAG: hypothetical protein DRR00_06825 [Gammaproteobacteria bacterium]RKZ58299.1 MAG: hypothetical protein DRQ99_25630 [Gammaproteobacteria bacterium]RKZ88990.1 MAG: hypothetical protein DRR16_03620 [Gammaproteobacteria bacterium]